MRCSGRAPNSDTVTQRVQAQAVILLYLAAGGGVGAVARFAVGGWVTTWAGVGFPWATYVINVIGSGLLGFLSGALPRANAAARMQAFLTVGVCGGFTTFSTFDYETFVLIGQQRYLLAASYVTLSVTTCIAGVFAGIRLSQMWPRRRQPV